MKAEGGQEVGDRIGVNVMREIEVRKIGLGKRVDRGDRTTEFG